MSSSVFANFEDAIAILKKGGVLIYPPETFLALGCRADATDAVALIVEIKRRPGAKPFPLIASDMEQIALVGDISGFSRSTLERLWPAPLAILIPALAHLDSHLKNGQNIAAVRVPDSRLTRTLARECGAPLVATSANFSGDPPASVFSEIDPEFLAVARASGAGVLRDDGERKYDKPSSIIEFLDPVAVRILREGAISRDELEKKGLRVI
ncbi:MAG: L-threonylcarbamoyladenylate synthase [Desulfovibrio sp.]|nr:L-threonylcarbamoyladenylate synthase [Desulfovibrio sp.]